VSAETQLNPTLLKRS